MTHSQRLRQLADRTGLDGFADELRAMADEIDAQAPVSDAEILTEAARHLGEMVVGNCGLGDIKAFARAILALRQQAVPMTDEPKAAHKLIGWRTENFLWETDEVDTARNWEPNIGVLPIFEGDPNTKLGSAGITQRADGGEV